MLEIINHRLVEGGKVRPYKRPHSPRKQPFDKTSGPFREGWLEAVIIHYTAASKKSSLGTLLGKPRVSCQLIIDESGNIYQTLDFNERAWHAGTSKWNGKEFWNNRSIGIELVNNGPLTLEDGKFKALFRKTIAPENVMCGKHRNDASESLFWEKYLVAQLDSAARLTRLLTQTYNLDLVLGHDD
ncbi:MAG: N-acetylmuramoyl-L-alanine amidase, partial [Bacteroidota bacterium]